MNHIDNYTIRVIARSDKEGDEGILVGSPSLLKEVVVEFVDAPPREVEK